VEPGVARKRPLLAALIAAFACVAPAGCGVQSPLDPQSEPARKIADLWWMLAASAVVLLGALVLIAWSWRRRGQEGLPLLGNSERASTALVVLFGVGIPIVALIALFVVSNLVVIKQTDAPAKASTEMTIEVVAHQWFWEIRYTGTTAVTANEIHIPARTRVNTVVRTADVIHSFWVPQLNRKVDAVPGHPNRLLLYADRPGRYRGDCAELCGLQHSHMGLYVFADEPRQFQAWLNEQARPAREPIVWRIWSMYSMQYGHSSRCASSRRLSSAGSLPSR
jgi:cytochrome c oxidase subunit II